MNCRGDTHDPDQAGTSVFRRAGARPDSICQPEKGVIDASIGASASASSIARSGPIRSSLQIVLTEARLGRQLREADCEGRRFTA